MRNGEVGDIKSLESVLSKKYSTALNQFNTSVNLEESPYTSYIMTCDEQIVGMAILGEQEDLEYLNSHYQVSKAPSYLFREWFYTLEKLSFLTSSKFF